jgi:hypothetical protein
MIVYSAADLATGRLVDRCLALFQIKRGDPTSGPTGTRLAHILSMAGSPNLLLPTRLTQAELTAHGETRLAGAIAHAISRGPQTDNFALEINRATTNEIMETCAISNTLAEHIVAERQLHGPFRSAADLDKRVEGIGDAISERISAIAGFGPPWAPTDLRRLPWHVQLFVLGSAEFGVQALTRALDVVSTACSGSPHPKSLCVLEKAAPSSSLKFNDITQVVVLRDAKYVSALEHLFSGARVEILICMFHIALGADGTGSRKLIDSVIGAHARGVAVRVLLDRDQKSDPYRSTVINSLAMRTLKDAGIEVRPDRSDVLLHSKFVVTDRDEVVVGSHNWSAGSFERMDDVSLMLKSRETASQLKKRFELLWTDAGTP